MKHVIRLAGSAPMSGRCWTFPYVELSVAPGRHSRSGADRLKLWRRAGMSAGFRTASSGSCGILRGMAVDAEQHAALDELREPPSGTKPVPPARTAPQELPFGQLDWGDFEKLCERLATLEGSPERVARYGTRGQSQAGIDIYSRLPNDGGYVVYQCKRYETLFPSHIRNAVSEFLSHHWSSVAKRFVFCTSHSLVPTSLADEVEVQANRLKECNPPIALDTWDETSMSRNLKSHPDLVEDFFGVGWRGLFSPGEAGRVTEAAQIGVHAQLATALLDVVGRLAPRVVVVTLDWAPEALRKVLASLAAEDDETYLRFRDLVGDPPVTELVLSNIASPASWLAASTAQVWTVMALLAEQQGEWRAASRAWELSASRQDDDRAAAGAFVSAAASASVGGDLDGHARLLGRARDRYANHPRVRLQEVRDLPAQEQLEALAEVETVEPAEISLVAGQQALAALILPDLELAQQFVDKAVEAAPESVAARSVAINLEVQRARLKVIDGRSQEASVLRRAHRSALTLRDKLLRQRRWEESGRILMLAADALALQGEVEDARDLLMQVTPDELAARDVADVLGNAALRTLGPREALRLTEDAPLTDGIRRIRATATLEAGAVPADRAKARAELDELVLQGGEEAAEAAFARLDDAMERGGWSEPAEACLIASGHRRPALLLRAFYLGSRHASWAEAYELFDDYAETRWGCAARLRVATSWGRYSIMTAAADALMTKAPGHVLTVECGRAYARTGAFQRATEVLRPVAEDDTAPRSVRADAYFLLVRIAGIELDDWELAAELHRAWVRVRPGDTRASTFAPTIASRHRTRLATDV
jgi:hypothetical protein